MQQYAKTFMKGHEGNHVDLFVGFGIVRESLKGCSDFDEPVAADGFDISANY